MPTFRHHIYVMFGCRQYRRGQTMATISYVVGRVRGGGIYAQMMTCWHDENDSVVHLLVSNIKCWVVIKPYRHADAICMSCLVVGYIGRGSNHPDMPIFQQYHMLWGGMNKCRHADMPTTTVLFIWHFRTEIWDCYKNMSTCRHQMYVMFGYRQCRRGVKPCQHSEMLTISYVSFENQKVNQGWSQKILTTRFNDSLK